MTNLRDMDDAELHRKIADWKPETVQHISAMRELRRREGAPAKRRERVAIGIAIVSAIIAGITLFICFQP